MQQFYFCYNQRYERTWFTQTAFKNDSGIFRTTLYNMETFEVNVFNMEMRVLELCNIPKSRKILEAHFKEDIAIPYFMNKYVHPMIERGILGLDYILCSKK